MKKNLEFGFLAEMNGAYRRIDLSNYFVGFFSPFLSGWRGGGNVLHWAALPGNSTQFAPIHGSCSLLADICRVLKVFCLHLIIFFAWQIKRQKHNCQFSNSKIFPIQNVDVWILWQFSKHEAAVSSLTFSRFWNCQIALLKILLAAAPTSKAKTDSINILADVLPEEMP